MITRDLPTAIQHLKSGKLLGLPTETVYGLAASIRYESSLREIFRIKERPFFDPLIVHVAEYEQIPQLVTHWPEEAQILSTYFWPGPLTFVLPKSAMVSDLITSGLENVGIRMPRHPETLAVLKEVGPVAAPSANKFMKTSPTLAEHVEEEFGSQGLLTLDGGPCEIGLESTVIKVEANLLRILRPGGISKEEILEVIEKEKLNLRVTEESSADSPGQMEQHYQPQIPLVILRTAFSKQELEKTLEPYREKLNLKKNSFFEITLEEDPVLIARKLYAQMRQGSQSGAEIIIVNWGAAMRESGLWKAIWDRLRKASTLILD